MPNKQYGITHKLLDGKPLYFIVYWYERFGVWDALHTPNEAPSPDRSLLEARLEALVRERGAANVGYVDTNAPIRF